MLDIKKLKQLRLETGISIALCKKALEQSNNDILEAKKLLRKWGIENIKDKINHSTSQGAIFSYIHHNKKIAALVEILCETDFVANNTELIKFGNELCMQIASIPAKNVEELMNQEYIRDPNKKISDLINEAVLKFGENIKVGRFIRWEMGE
ncbi:hypothetical protein A3I50_01185 [Candidatus Roizmanbacteria bacterium RIFCSPLOWO2_02_FULL_37_9]|nr:MAG: hypothetical protein A3I50_01185 [Candidatus Roizmanbacteria bacterium RIFCSPLOWO2_02_FULL_37_9]